MEEFKQLLLKKQKEQMKHPADKEKLKAKANVMKDLSDLLSKDMGEDMASMKKVTVASDSKEGLEKGLEKAKHIIEKKPEMDESSEEEKKDLEESLESPEEEEKELEEGSEDSEDVDSEIKKLEEKIAALKAKKAE
jgi:chromosome segregation ATPase